MPTYLADILAAHRAQAEADGRALPDLVEQAASTPPPRDFAGALSDAELKACATLADQLGLAALVEVHDQEELTRALDAGAGLVGVNQRDLRTFQVDHGRACALAARIPSGVVAVAESGIRDADDARRLADAGYDAILVGETLVRAADRTAAVRALVGHPVTP